MLARVIFYLSPFGQARLLTSTTEAFFADQRGVTHAAAAAQTPVDQLFFANFAEGKRRGAWREVAAAEQLRRASRA